MSKLMFEIGDKAILNTTYGGSFVKGSVVSVYDIDNGETVYPYQIELKGNKVWVFASELSPMGTTSQPNQEFAIAYNVTIKGQEFRLDHSEFKRLKNMVNAIGEL